MDMILIGLLRLPLNVDFLLCCACYIWFFLFLFEMWTVYFLICKNNHCSTFLLLIGQTNSPSLNSTRIFYYMQVTEVTVKTAWYLDVMTYWILCSKQLSNWRHYICYLEKDDNGRWQGCAPRCLVRTDTGLFHIVSRGNHRERGRALLCKLRWHTFFLL